jgi:prostaglandin-H2 D-isomerase / glutathione transferase
LFYIFALHRDLPPVFGQPSRLALTAGGIPFKDTRVGRDEFASLKTSGRLPLGQLPVLVVDGETISQSSAIIRYCGRLAGLYPGKDDLETTRMDELMGIVEDITMALFKHRGQGEEIVRAGRDEFNTKLGPTMLGGLESLAKKNKASDQWMCGASMSIADLSAYYTIGNVVNGFIDHVPRETFDKYPRIMAAYNAVLSHPKLADWHKAHPWK